MSDSSPGRNLAAEFVGTTILMLGGPGVMVLVPDATPLMVALGFGISIAIAIGVIGAVANPMFSLALWFSRGITSGEALTDVLGQFAGAIFGGALLFGLNSSTRLSVGVNGWQPELPVIPGNIGLVIAAELVIGTIVTVVFLSSISQQTSNVAVAAFTGAAYGLGTLLLLDLSGGGFNPARSLGAALWADTEPNALGQVWLFLVLPVGAAFAGMLIWLAIDDATIDDTVFDGTILDDIADKAAELAD